MDTGPDGHRLGRTPAGTGVDGPARMTVEALEPARWRRRPLLPGNQVHRPGSPRLKSRFSPGLLSLADEWAGWFHVKRAMGGERQPACPTARLTADGRRSVPCASR